MLDEALRSSVVQQLDAGNTFDVVVVDNSAEHNAEQQVRDFARSSAVRIRYIHEPKPGISAARNCGVAASKGDFVAFLDDDEAATSSRWLAHLLHTQRRFRADAVFGKVECVVLGGERVYAEMVRQMIGRDLGSRACVVPDQSVAQLGTGNSLFRLDRLQGSKSFDNRLGKSGGEDTALISRLARAGARFAWAPDAVVKESAEASRACLRFVIERRFSNGQMRTYQQVTGGRGPHRVAMWMTIGAAQAAMGGMRFLRHALFDDDRKRGALAEIAAGVGKVLWHPALRLNVYHPPAVLRSARATVTSVEALPSAEHGTDTAA